MGGEKNLDTLLRKLQPVLNQGVYVFCSLKEPDLELIEKSICHFKEEEGTTLILKKEYADIEALSYTFEASWLTLQVHSALDAVGMTAAFSSALTNHGVSCNVIAGYHHDHLFVPVNETERAMQVLRTLSKGQ